MKTRTFAFLFAGIAAILAGTFFISKKITRPQETSLTRAKIITPKSKDSGEKESKERADKDGTNSFDTFVPLLSSETLINSLTVDINDDTYDDEIIVVRRAGSQYLWIVPGIYNPTANRYERLELIQTKISRTKTFSYNCMDITGDHRMALIYQGLDDRDNSVMEIFICGKEKGRTKLENIGSFSSDGTIFIQQTERSDSYALSLSNGESFSVWVYKSDRNEKSGTNSNPTGTNQIQAEYKWNPGTQKYELAREIKVTASRLAAKELSRIQDGTVETFASFLDGLWYKTENSEPDIRYIYFDFDNREIILLYGDSQEVYEWDNSKLRHNGIYLTTVNATIQNLQRRLDIALTGTDSIRVTARDAINLTITENTMWDGQYKKMSIQNSFSAPEKTPLNDITENLQSGPSWTSSESDTEFSFGGQTYTLKSPEREEKGIFSTMKIGSYNVIQFRADTGNSVLNEFYSFSYGTKTVTETVRKRTVEKNVTDRDVIHFEPVKITPTNCFTADGKSFFLTRNSAAESRTQ